MNDKPATLKPTGPMRVSLKLKGVLILAVPLLFQLSLIGVLFYLHDRAEAYAVRAGHARDLNSALQRYVTRGAATIYHIDRALESNTALDRAGTEDAAALGADAGALAKEVVHFADAGQLNHEAGKTAISQVMRCTGAIERMVPLVDSAAANRSDQAAYDNTVKQLKDERRTASDVIIQIGELNFGKIKYSPEHWAQDRTWWETAAVTGTVINVFVVLLMGLYFSRSIVQRVLVILDNSIRLAAGKELHPIVRENDEIAQLDSAFHQMADVLRELLHKERSIVENASDVICSLDENAAFLSVNSAAKAVFGYAPEDLIGGNLFNLVPDDDSPFIAEQLKIAKAQGTEHHFESRLIRKDTRIIDILWSMRWSESDRGMFCVAHDITERKNVDRLRQEVTQMVSHDLRTPLTTVLGFHQMLEDGVLGSLNEKGQHFLAASERNIERMLRLVEDLLEIEKLESGTLEIHRTNAQLSSIIEQAVQLVKHHAEAKGVNLQTVPSDICVTADGDRLIQVITNLLSNAIKFSPSGSTVTTQASRTADCAVIEVIDQGRGIPPDMIDTVFDRFKQVKSGDAASKRGYGLGLAICKALIELHGGKISVRSSEGKGSTFAIAIPCSIDASQIKRPQKDDAMLLQK